MHDDDRLTRLEEAIFGTGNSGGVLNKIVRIENELEHMNRTLSAININLSKLVWIIIAAFMVALLGLIMKPHGVGSPTNNSTSVQVGQAEKTMAKSGRDYLTVAEVATAEDVAPRTIVDWIDKGRIQPLPLKQGKEYTIAKDYRILPQDAASSGTDEQDTLATHDPL
jgi:hypothetical protein